MSRGRIAFVYICNKIQCNGRYYTGLSYILLSIMELSIVVGRLKKSISDEFSTWADTCPSCMCMRVYFISALDIDNDVRHNNKCTV